MPSDINPTLAPTKSLSNFRFWCQKVLPLVYDDSLSYYEVLGKMVVQLNDVIDDVNADIENVDTLKEAFLALQTYVNEFFADIDQLASYAERAEAAQTAANASAINAASSASNASASSLAAMDARDAAVTAKEAAEASANTASEASTNANTKASEAAESANTSQTAATSAANSATAASGSATNATASAASALQNFQLSDAARVAAQEAAEDAEEASQDAISLLANLTATDISANYNLNDEDVTTVGKSIIKFGDFIFYSLHVTSKRTANIRVWMGVPVVNGQGSTWSRSPQTAIAYASNIADPEIVPCAIGDGTLRVKGANENWHYIIAGFFKHNITQ